MEAYKKKNKTYPHNGTFRPYCGVRCNLHVTIPKHPDFRKKTEEKEQEEPLTPGSIHSAPPNWYTSPFTNTNDEQEDEEFVYPERVVDDEFLMDQEAYDEWLREYESR